MWWLPETLTHPVAISRPFRAIAQKVAIPKSPLTRESSLYDPPHRAHLSFGATPGIKIRRGR